MASEAEQARDEHVEFQLRLLSSENPRRRANMLRALGEMPTADLRILEACEHLLGDSTITLLSIPYRFGEIRSLAVEAVIRVRAALGMTEALKFEGVLRQLDVGEIGLLARAEGIQANGTGHELMIALLSQLVWQGKAPRRDWAFSSDDMRELSSRSTEAQRL